MSHVRSNPHKHGLAMSRKLPPQPPSDVFRKVLPAERERDVRILDPKPGPHRNELYALRFRSYGAAGYEMPFADGLFRDDYDELASTVLVGTYDDGKPVGTMRINIRRPGDVGRALPCEEIYPEVEGIVAAASGPVVEISRVAIDPDQTYAAGKTGVYAALVRMGLIYCMATDAAVSIAASHVRWRLFYEQVFGFAAITGPRPYPPGNNPILLMTRDFRSADKRVALRNPFFRITEADVDRLRAILGEKATPPFGRPPSRTIVSPTS